MKNSERYKNLLGQVFGELLVLEKTNERLYGSIVWKCRCSCGNIIKVSSKNLLRTAKNCGCMTSPKILSLVGKRFGDLLVINKTEKRKHANIVWECKCDCGNTIFVDILYLHNNISCGCKNKYNLVGKRFGRLLVLESAGKNKWGNHQWKCQCDCGNITYVLTGSLRENSSTKSCGCLRQENRKIRMKKINDTTRLAWGESSLNILYAHYEYGAKKRNHSFELSKEEFIDLVQQNCSYCGNPPIEKQYSKGSNGPCLANGIDRIDNTKGYTLENCVTCCGVCNRMKSTMTQKEFLEHIAKIAEFTIKNAGKI
jgi:hypothetical protein